MWNYLIYQSMLRIKLVSPGWPTDSLQWFGYSGHSWAIWVTGSVPTYQSPSSVNERWAWGRVALPVWLRPLCSCQSPRAWSHGSPWRQWHVPARWCDIGGSEGLEWQLGWAMRTWSIPPGIPTEGRREAGRLGGVCTGGEEKGAWWMAWGLH